MTLPPQWTADQLAAELDKAIELFRKERLEEDVTEYGSYFDQFQGHMETLIEQTVDLSQLEAKANDILTDADGLKSARYLAGPPISEDDLEVIAQAALSPARLRNDPKMVERVIQVILAGLDRHRFPWVLEGREPTEGERQAAVIASAALMATRKIEADRRNESSRIQQQAVTTALISLGMTKSQARHMNNLRDAPKVGEFCGEAKLCGRKADITIGLYDGRVMPIECKVSNSFVNSIKRLNNDAAAKAEGWRNDLGTKNVIPVAVIGGLYQIRHMLSAQERGLSIIWAHEMKPLLDFIESTKVAATKKTRKSK